MASPRLLILGLDALPWRVLTPMIEAEAMPRLKALVERGCSGVLRSTIPHQTPAAWTTFMTGVQPTTHGIVNWQRYDATTHSLRFNNVERYAGKTIYERFSQAGLRVGVVMQPVTFPPFKVNGFLLSGFDSPGIKEPFAYPRELEPEILKLCPSHAENLGLEEHWQGASGAVDDATFVANLELLNERVKRITKLSLDLYARNPVDVLMVYFQDPDLLLHRAWRWSDPLTWNDSVVRRDAVQKFFKTLDSCCGELSDTFHHGNADCYTLTLSDHGQQPDVQRVRLNSILMELGFLVPASGVALVREKFKRLLKEKGASHGLGIQVDWKRTRAFMPLHSCTGYVYVNLQGRQPQGSVAVGDFQRVRDDVMAALKSFRDPKTKQNYFLEVAPLAAQDASLNLPDIYVQPAPGVEFVRKAKRGAFSFPTKRPFAGIHEPDGLYILNGPNVTARRETNAQIADLAPTLLAMCGQAVPSYMEGRVLNECFQSPLQVTTVPFPWEANEAGDAYSAEGAAAVEKRLADLGYLD